MLLIFSRLLGHAVADLDADPMQLVDELNMIYTACLMCYATFSFSQSRFVRQVLAIGLLSLAIFITVSTALSRHTNRLTCGLSVILPLSPGPPFPPECIRHYHSRCLVPLNVCYGSQHSAILEGEIWYGASEN
jgi:hypothetical protein